jgi:soluble lytic murein transglycosylase-like protein/TolA-binding protein
MAVLKFRPHHFLCTVGFEGKGYSDAFVENFKKISALLKDSPAGDEQIIQVIAETDAICEPCPNRLGDLCATQEKIESLDRAHAKVLGIKPGDQMSWKTAKNLIVEKMTDDQFNKACAPCAWKGQGICEKALTNLKKASLLVLALYLFTTPTAEAAKKKNRKIANQTSTLDPIGKLEKQKASPPAKALKRAYDAYKKGNCQQAKTDLNPTINSKDLVDHALYLRALCALQDSEKALSTKNWSKAKDTARSGIKDLERIKNDFTYSPWFKEANESIGQLQIIEGLSLTKQKKWASAQTTFESGLQLLSISNALYHLSPEMIGAYATSCQKKSGPLCKAWILTLAQSYSKNTQESKSLTPFFPEIVETAKPNYATGKITVAYTQKDADLLAYEAAFANLPADQWKEGQKTLENFLADYPRSTHRQRARFWLAQAIEKNEGKDSKATTQKAKPLYEQILKESPLTFYGVLSSWALKLDPSQRISSNRPSLSDEDPFQGPTESYRLNRSKNLIAANADFFATKDLLDLKPRDTAQASYLIYLAKVASLGGAHLTAFSILSELISRNDETVYSEFALDMVFPKVEWAIIQKQAKEIDVDPILVLSLMKQESAFNGLIHSRSGASGYMQLMPFTASDVEPDVKRRDLLDAETNIRIGTKYLKKLLIQFNGNVAYALAGYNAGPNAVNRWIKEGKGDLGMLAFIEQIPYTETRDYVGSIFRNYVWYKRRIEAKTVSSIDTFWPTAETAKKD